VFSTVTDIALPCRSHAVVSMAAWRQLVGAAGSAVYLGGGSREDSLWISCCKASGFCCYKGSNTCSVLLPLAIGDIGNIGGR
jgi:hypothetical protein